MHPNNHSYDVAVIGAGIVGLAVATTAARQGLKVAVFERNSRAIGASVRNFGMIWPVGQPAGTLQDRALRSREIYLDLASEVGFWHNPNGSLHLAYHPDEWAVLEEFAAQSAQYGIHRPLMQHPQQILDKSPAVQPNGLIGALWSETELIVDPREVVQILPDYLAETYGVDFFFDTAITYIESPLLQSFGYEWEAERIYVCSGSDFETLYPEVFADSEATKCKLQMMRTIAQPDQWRMGASLCAGLTLTHYASFKNCSSLSALKQRIQETMPAYVNYGIHVLVSQNAIGELTLGDSHEYSLTPDPFDKAEIDQLILNYLATFARFPELRIQERWQGIYPKLPNGQTELILEVEPHVWIINGLGGAGMTLSFGLAEQLLKTGSEKLIY